MPNYDIMLILKRWGSKIWQYNNIRGGGVCQNMTVGDNRGVGVRWDLKSDGWSLKVTACWGIIAYIWSKCEFVIFNLLSMAAKPKTLSLNICGIRILTIFGEKNGYSLRPVCICLKAEYEYNYNIIVIFFKITLDW